jgi:hypothetical protein
MLLVLVELVVRLLPWLVVQPLWLFVVDNP